MKKVLYAYGLLLAAGPGIALADDGSSFDDTVHVMMLGFCLAPALYFLPSIIAASRKHARSDAIFTLNLLAGWTIVGWAAAMVWAVAYPGVAMVEEPGIAPVLHRADPGVFPVFEAVAVPGDIKPPVAPEVSLPGTAPAYPPAAEGSPGHGSDRPRHVNPAVASSPVPSTGRH